MKAKRSVGAIVLAAGRGTRMHSQRAKVLHELGGEPLITYPLRILRRLGIDPIVVVVGFDEARVRSACAPFAVQFARQTEQRGTGHAARSAAPSLKGFEGDLLLVNGDLPLLQAESFTRLITAQRKERASVSLLTAHVPQPQGFGRILRRDGGGVEAIVEEKDASPEDLSVNEVNVGLYCIDATFLFDALRRLRPSKATGELYLTDVIAAALRSGRRVAAAQAEPVEGTQISSRRDLAAVEQLLRERIQQRWLDAGVTLEDPSSTYIGPLVEIGPDTVIGPNVILRGETRVGARCRFDGSARLVDARLGDDVHVKFGVVMSGVEIGEQAQIGPFAQLRPETRLGAGVHIGNFVETKKAVLGAGTKANHLAYIGDAEVGCETNIGAGTITCNYDGFQKHKTRIGDRVQVGSDTQLIAPVSVGDDAYISTGSTVRTDVVPGALYFNPKREMQREGWVALRRQKEADRGRGAMDAKKPASAIAERSRRR